MTDVDPKIWENPTLGAANGLPYLDEVSSQQVENLNARRENRDPVKVEPVARFSDGSTNMTKYVVEGEVVDPSLPTKGIAYFNPEVELTPSGSKLPEQSNGTPVEKASKAPTAHTAKK